MAEHETAHRTADDTHSSDRPWDRNDDMATLSVDELQDLAEQRDLATPSSLGKDELIVALSGGGYRRRTGG
jgi:hypothetical protein